MYFVFKLFILSLILTLNANAQVITDTTSADSTQLPQDSTEFYETPGDALEYDTPDSLIAPAEDSLTVPAKNPETQSTGAVPPPPPAPRRRPVVLPYDPKLNTIPSQLKIDTTVIDMWVPEAAISLNLSQIALSNWTQGGDNSLTWTVVTTSGVKYLGPEWNFRTNFKAAYGRTKLGSQDYRTNDNELFLELVLSKRVEWDIDPYFSNTVRTAITSGYNYKVTPAVKIADFFDPGYVTQAVGFTYDKSAIFKTRLGFAVKETFTDVYREYSDDPNTEKIEAFRIETGLESASTLDFEFMENMKLKSSLRLFTSYENPDVWDVRWDNNIIGRVNDYINVSLSVLVIYEKKQSPKTQMKQSLQLGFTYTIF